jgi:membrane associated rhomboid family serine protease
MTFLEKLERAAGRYAVPGLIRYVVMLNALVYLLVLVNKDYAALLVLDRDLILQGQLWRLVTWIFLPNTLSPIWILFFLWFTWFVGEQLEGAWGAFRLNLYYLLGCLGCTMAVMIFGASAGNYLLTLSLLLALATLAPDLQVLLLVIPIKLKWLALLSLAFPWGLYLIIGTPGMQAMILVCLANYLVFFGPGWLRRMREDAGTRARRAKFQVVQPQSLHRCETCGLTEIDDPHAEFRVAGDGNEYCPKHLPPRSP